MHRLYAVALIALLFCASPIVNAQTQVQQDKSALFKKVPSAARLLNNSAQGREFWIAIPPNEKDNGYPTLNLEIYVTSSRDTKVTLEHPGTGYQVTKDVKAYSITTFTTADGTANWAWEVRDDERASDQGIRLTASQPISVYVLNAKPVTSDGYLALPTTTWGTKYMHMSMYDFGEFTPDDWAQGFVVIAKENGTRIQFRLDGVNYGGSAGGRSRLNKKLNQNVTVTLQRGQTYMIRGNGKTLGESDFSGTVVTSNKPIGFLSFHMRTMIPSFPSPNNGRDHLVEMIPPMSTWGKQYVTLELQRDANRGDFFRVFAAEPNTKFRCRYTDLKTGTVYNWEGVLKEPGDFAEKENTWPPSTSIKGTAVWTADKPFFVMQYSYSAEWDAAALFDPAMCISVPVEQYTLETVFQTPSNVEFVNNYFNILAVGDPNDPDQAKLKTITVDGKPVWVSQPTFLVNRVQNTNIYWARLKLPPGAHHIKGETPFGGVIYGFASFASYLWPAATALNKLDQLDTLKPLLDTVAECGDYEVTATERRDQEPNAAGDSTQIDTGINQIELDPDASFNYRLELVTADENNIHIEERREEFVFRLRVIDKSQDAFALYYVMDRAGNVAVDSVRYTAELVAMRPDSIIFGKVRLNTSKVMTAKIVNPTKRDVKLENIWLNDAKVFKILSPDASSFPLVVPAGGEIDITFEYTPVEEMKAADDYDQDSVFAQASCGKFVLGWLRGQGVMPRIVVGDWDAGAHQVGTEYCNTDEQGTLIVKNPGTDTLTITAINNVAAPFALKNVTPALPIRIPPGGEVTIKTLCYTPEKNGTDKLDVVFESDVDLNDKSNDNVSEWIGRGQNPGPKITSLDFEQKRVNTRHTGEIVLTNTGNFTLNVTGYRVNHQAGDQLSLKVLSVKLDGTQDIDVASVTGTLSSFTTSIPLFQNEANRIVFTVEFIPQAETSYEQLIIPTYANSEAVVEGTVLGEGILPHMVIDGYDFQAVKQGTISQEVGTVTITNTSTTAVLTVRSVTLSNVPNSAFELRAENGQKNPTAADPLVIPIGETRAINVYFTAEPTSDSYIGPFDGTNPNYVDDVTVVADIKAGDGINAEGDFFDAQVDKVTGKDFTEGEPGINVTDINFGDVLLCNTPTGTFTVTNTGTIDLTVTNFQYLGNTAVYTITDDQGTSVNSAGFFPFTVQAGASKTFNVLFTPSVAPAPYDLDVVVVSNAPVGQDDMAQLRGQSYTVPVKFTVSSNTKPQFPGEDVAVHIRATSGKMNEVRLDRFTMVLTYEAEALRYQGTFSRTAGLNGWNIDVQPDVPARGQITIVADQGTGAPFVQEGPGGEFLTLNFRVYLSAKDELPLPLSVAQSDLGSRTICVIPSTEAGLLVLGELCVRDFRGVRYIEKFGLRQNTPNPSERETEIEYSVAFEAPVKLAVYNSLGEEVKVLVDGVREAGVYRVRINTADLPSGTYVYRLIAGPYTESRQMVITR